MPRIFFGLLILLAFAPTPARAKAVETLDDSKPSSNNACAMLLAQAKAGTKLVTKDPATGQPKDNPQVASLVEACRHAQQTCAPVRARLTQQGQAPKGLDCDNKQVAAMGGICISDYSQELNVSSFTAGALGLQAQSCCRSVGSTTKCYPSLLSCQMYCQ